MNSIQSVLDRIGVTRLCCITGYDDFPIHVYQSCRPNAIHLTVDSGKGWTDESAWLATAVESIERYAAENIGNQVVKYRSSLPVRDERVSSLVDCIVGKNALNGSIEYFPVESVEYRLSNPLRLLNKFPMGTTGLGAHTDSALAVVSGLVEVVERVVISSAERYELRLDDMSSDNKKLIMQMKKKVSDLRCYLYKSAWPVYVCAIESRERSVTGGFNAFGLGENPQHAVTDCVAEAMQTWLMRIAASRDDWFYAAQYESSSVAQERADEVIDFLGQEDMPSSKYNTELSNKILESADRQDIKIGYVDIKPKVLIDPVHVCKVFAWPTPSLRQGSMLTGFPL